MIGLCLPGQGYQKAGLLVPFLKNRLVAPILTEIDAALPKLQLSKALTDSEYKGPLTQTSIAQPLILAATFAVFKCWRSENPETAVKYAMGHSLGEISALAIANSLGLTEALQLVHARGLAMEPAQGGMTLVVTPRKLDSAVFAAQLQEVCHVNQLDIANYNSQTQTVLSGTLRDLRNGVETLQRWQKTITKPLAVSGPFHSRLMAGAQPELARLVEGLDLKTPEFEIISNKTAQPFAGVEEIATSIPEMLVSPVRWWQSAAYMAENVDKIVSLAPGRVGKLTAAEYKTPTEYYDEPAGEAA